MPDEPSNKTDNELDVTENSSGMTAPKSTDGFMPSTQKSSVTPMSEEKVEALKLEMEDTTHPAPATESDNKTENTAVFGTKKSKKKRFILVGVFAAVLLLLAGSFAAYAWYQSPDKVIVDSMISVMSAKTGSIDGTFKLASKDFDINATMSSDELETKAGAGLTISFKPKSSEIPIPQLDLTADVVTVQDQSIYFKFGNLQKIVDAYVDTVAETQASTYEQFGQKLSPKDIEKLKSEMKVQFTPIVSKIDDQWMKISYDELEEIAGADDGSQKCAENVGNKFTTDKSMQNEVVGVYNKNKFVTVEEELGVKNGNLGYVVGFDATKAKSFADAVADTKMGKELKKCDEAAFDTLKELDFSDGTDAFKNARFELWAEQWSHEMKQIVYTADLGEGSDKASMNLDMQMQLNTTPTVDVPTDARPFKDVQADIEQLLNGAVGSEAVAQPSI